VIAVIGIFATPTTSSAGTVPICTRAAARYALLTGRAAVRVPSILLYLFFF
jgi:hypothetical protein